MCDKCLGPLEVVYDYDKVKHGHQPREDRIARQEPVALSRAAADRGRAAHRPLFGLHAARQSRPAREEARRPRAVSEGRLGQPSDVLLQGSRRLGCGHACGRARVQGVRLRVDGQPRQQRVGARRAPRAAVLRLHPARSGGEQDSRLGRSTTRRSSPSRATTTM